MTKEVVTKKQIAILLKRINELEKVDITFEKMYRVYKLQGISAKETEAIYATSDYIKSELKRHRNMLKEKFNVNHFYNPNTKQWEIKE